VEIEGFVLMFIRNVQVPLPWRLRKVLTYFLCTLLLIMLSQILFPQQPHHKKDIGSRLIAPSVLSTYQKLIRVPVSIQFHPKDALQKLTLSLKSRSGTLRTHPHRPIVQKRLGATLELTGNPKELNDVLSTLTYERFNPDAHSDQIDMGLGAGLYTTELEFGPVIVPEILEIGLISSERPTELAQLIDNIRRFYPKVKLLVADGSWTPLANRWQNVDIVHIQTGW
jgi:hypothetical protein